GLESSVIRDILRLTRGGDVLSLAGGLPAPESFPVADVALAVADLDPAALQYAPTEGLDEVRSFVAQRLCAAGRDVTEDDVLVTKNAPEVLSAGLVKDADAVEAFMADAR
ncbi:MAG: aminotransferase, partial [Proteobacteria bacterium]|nr:aminotransferase [Pseudomonadota bacterium]